MKRLIMITLLLLIIFSAVYAQIVDWGIYSGLVLSKSIGSDDTYNLNYNVYQNFTMLDTTSIDTTSQTYITDKILVGRYYVMSRKVTLKPTISLGVFLSYKISEARNTFIIQPEINWSRYLLEFKFENNAQIYHFEGEKTYELSDSTEYVHSYSGEEIMKLSENKNHKVTTSVDFIKIPLLFKVQREFGSKNVGFLYLGPSLGYKIVSKTELLNDMKNIFDKYTDQDSLTTYTTEKINNSIDKINSMQFNAVFGLGWRFDKIFGIGLGKDQLTIDLRNEINLNNFSSLPINDRLKFYSFKFLLGYHF